LNKVLAQMFHVKHSRISRFAKNVSRETFV